MGWQKRGSGRCYDSSTGVGTMIGNMTGKVVGYEVMSKECRKCSYHLAKGCNPPDHICPKNYTGSSKGMEPAAAVAITKQVEKHPGVRMGTLIMDDDTTTLARIRNNVHDVTKWSDTNHTMRNLNNSLYAIAPNHKDLTPDVIAGLKRYFAYAISTNKGCPEKVKKAIENVVPHAFGDHTNCGNWCRFLTDPNYRHKNLPNGDDLHGEDLRAALEIVFKTFANKAETIAPGGSTKEVESMNNLIASKAPKSRHYGASEALKTKVSVAVGQKNVGHTLPCKVNASMGLSPGQVASTLGIKRDKKRRKQREVENSQDFKRKKLEKKAKKKIQNKAKETREGVTYQTGVGLTEVQPSDIEEIPPAVTIDPDITDKDAMNQLIYFDLETSGLACGADILQIAAQTSNDPVQSYNQYVTPTQRIYSTKVTGLKNSGSVLMLHGKPVSSVPIRQALLTFIEWLESTNSNFVLVAHNAPFDARHLIYHLKNEGLLSRFQSICGGFVDTLPLFKTLFPEKDHGQVALVSSVLGTTYEAHNALADVSSLQQLVNRCGAEDRELLNYAFSTKCIIDKMKNNEDAKVNAATFDEMVNAGNMSRYMANKAGASGLRVNHLKMSFDRGGFHGLHGLLSEEDVNGHPRVTKDKPTIRKMCKYFSA